MDGRVNSLVTSKTVGRKEIHAKKAKIAGQGCPIAKCNSASKLAVYPLQIALNGG
jgi:hypothetical protein